VTTYDLRESYGQSCALNDERKKNQSRAHHHHLHHHQRHHHHDLHGNHRA
jgi:hypothetical protein